MQRWSLSKLSGRLFAGAFAVLMVGMLKSMISLPCNEPGAWISVAGLALAALACAGLLIVAIKERSAGNLIVFLAGVAGTGMATLVAFGWTMLLCRGV